MSRSNATAKPSDRRRMQPADDVARGALDEELDAMPPTCAVCSAEAVWIYMPGYVHDAYCDEHVPSRGCSCMEGMPPDSEGRLRPCCEFAWIGPVDDVEESTP